MEGKILELIAEDRLEMPLSSLYQRTKRMKAKQAKIVASDLTENFDGNYESKRVFAYLLTEDNNKSRTMKEAVKEFSEEFPKYGAILEGKIAEKRAIKEKNLYFGVNPGCKLTSQDYMTVMQNLDFTESAANNLYPEIMKASRKLEKAKDEKRSILVG